LVLTRRVPLHFVRRSHHCVHSGLQRVSVFDQHQRITSIEGAAVSFPTRHRDLQMIQPKSLRHQRTQPASAAARKRRNRAKSCGAPKRQKLAGLRRRLTIAMM
jgi:hypothetical protein